MKPLFLYYPSCSTSLKALRWLQKNGIEFEPRDITRQNPTREELSDWIPRSGLPVRKFFNTSGRKYKEAGLKDRVPTASDTERIALLASDGMLVKRPLLVTRDFVLVGFDDATWRQRLLHPTFAQVVGI